MGQGRAVRPDPSRCHLFTPDTIPQTPSTLDALGILRSCEACDIRCGDRGEPWAGTCIRSRQVEAGQCAKRDTDLARPFRTRPTQSPRGASWLSGTNPSTSSTGAMDGFSRATPSARIRSRRRSRKPCSRIVCERPQERLSLPVAGWERVHPRELQSLRAPRSAVVALTRIPNLVPAQHWDYVGVPEVVHGLAM